MANVTKAPDASTTFMRLDNEPVKAWQAFMRYRDMGPERTLNKVRIQMGRPEVYQNNLEQWSMRWKWVQRARAFDDYTEKLQLRRSESEIPLWERRRQEVLEKNYQRAERLWERVDKMLDHPLTVEVKDDARGVVEVHPAKWSYSSIAQVAKMAAELQTGTIAEALPNDAEEEFDVDTATIEQLREFVARHSKRREEV